MRTLAITLVIATSTLLAGTARAQGYYNQQAYAQQAYAQQAYAQQIYAQRIAAARYAAMQAELERQRAAELAAQAAMQNALNDESSSAMAGVREIQTHGWERISARVRNVMNQLESWSGEQFTDLPTQTWNWGQAHAGGVIYFDLSSAMQSDAVLAFRLAHEWGHEALGHQPNVYNPTGRPRFVMSPTQDEDDADVYAGKFLCSVGYDVEEVEANLRRYPAITGDSHSSGAKRAMNVAQGCRLARGGTAVEMSSDDE